MPFSVRSTATFLVTTASMASATVYQGIRTGVDGSTSQVAWTNGTPDPCSLFTKIVDGTGSPCGQDFFVDGGNGPFRLFNCGVGDPVLERAGEFNAVCKYEPTTIKCANHIQQNWSC
ncbi:hypothetical protein PG984_012737 [Apiospora sp. TS-2023a]